MFAHHRKVVLSTNIGESSITIPDVVYVIDFCLTKYLEKDKDTNLTELKLNYASVDMCEQRKGRAGRTRPGISYRLVHRKFFKQNLLKNVPREIERCPLENCVLLGKSVYPDKTPSHFLSEACQPPQERDIDQAIKSLKELGQGLIFNLHSDKKGCFYTVTYPCEIPSRDFCLSALKYSCEKALFVYPF